MATLLWPKIRALSARPALKGALLPSGVAGQHGFGYVFTHEPRAVRTHVVFDEVVSCDAAQYKGVVARIGSLWCEPNGAVSCSCELDVSMARSSLS